MGFELWYIFYSCILQQSARYIEENGGADWLYALREKDYKEDKAELIKLCGVGAKVCTELIKLCGVGAKV